MEIIVSRHNFYYAYDLWIEMEWGQNKIFISIYIAQSFPIQTYTCENFIDGIIPMGIENIPIFYAWKT